MKKYDAWKTFYENLYRVGISQQEADQLRRLELILHRWAERECAGEIQWDAETGKTYRVSQAYLNGNGEYKHWPTPDRETGALRRLAVIMAAHGELIAYHQTDPRGCALYILRKSDIRENEKIGFVYSRGIAVCL